ncbi:MAG: YdcF family protein [Sphingomonas bacterium]
MILRILGVIVLFWAFGFALFAIGMPAPLGDVKTDGIVVLTGSPGRINHGIALLEKHAAQRMLISGVAPQVRPVELALEYRASPALFTCCIDLGHEAVDTRSNAEETAAWVKHHHYRSIRLVTSNWHMARARLELVNALGDDVTVMGDSVQSSPRFGQLVTEYNKLLVRRVALWLGLGA